MDNHCIFCKIFSKILILWKSNQFLKAALCVARKTGVEKQKLLLVYHVARGCAIRRSLHNPEELLLAELPVIAEKRSFILRFGQEYGIIHYNMRSLYFMAGA